MKRKKLDIVISKQLYKLGYKVGQKPYCLFPLFIVILLGCNASFKWMQYEADKETLYLPKCIKENNNMHESENFFKNNKLYNIRILQTNKQDILCNDKVKYENKNLLFKKLTTDPVAIRFKERFYIFENIEKEDKKFRKYGLLSSSLDQEELKKKTEMAEVNIIKIPLLILIVSSIINTVLLPSMFMLFSSFIGGVIAIVGITAGFGFAILCQVEFIDEIIIPAFLVTCKSVNMVFSILTTWRRFSRTKYIPTRLGLTMKKTFAPITLSAIVSIALSLTGLLSPFPVVKILCIYTIFAVLFTHISIITLFCSYVALTGYLKLNNNKCFKRKARNNLVFDKGRSNKKPNPKLFSFKIEENQDNNAESRLTFFRNSGKIVQMN